MWGVGERIRIQVSRRKFHTHEKTLLIELVKEPTVKEEFHIVEIDKAIIMVKFMFLNLDIVKERCSKTCHILS